MSLRFFYQGLLILCLVPGCAPGDDTLLIGAKIYEHSGPYDRLFDQWNDLGINTGFCSQELISDRDFMKLAREHGVSTFLIFPVFYNPEALSQAPELAAIKSNGLPATEEWVEFICPSREAYRKIMVEKARRLVHDYRPDGISIDFIRHFVYWEKVYPDREASTLPVCCFDSVCLHHFQSETGIEVPPDLNSIPAKAGWILETHQEEWTGWRCSLITSMVEEIAEAVREEKADILINIHLVPWGERDFNGAIKRVAGQDIEALSEHVSMLSPMTYTHMLKQDPAWIHELTDEMYQRTGGPIVPSIQVGKAYLETDYDLAEFRETIEQALRAPSGGLILWSWERLMAEPDKVDLFKEMLDSL